MNTVRVIEVKIAPLLLRILLMVVLQAVEALAFLRAAGMVTESALGLGLAICWAMASGDGS